MPETPQEALAAALRVFNALETWEGPDGRAYVRRRDVSAMLQALDPITQQPIPDSPFQRLTKEPELTVERLARALRTIGLIPEKTAADDHISDAKWERAQAATSAQAICDALRADEGSGR